MKANPLVSIVIPVYNVEQYVRKSFESIFSQTYENLEIIIVDDGTPDRSIEIIRELLDGKFSRIKSKVRIISQGNQGLAGARKTGLANATGEYLIQLDPDDSVSPKMIEKLVNAAVKDDADIVICNYYNCYNFWRVPRREKQYGDKMQILDAMFSHKHFRAYLWNKLIRRSLYEGDLLFPRRFMCEDMVFIGQLILKADKIVFINDYLYYYRKTHMSSLSHQLLEKRFKDVFINKADLWEYLDRNGDTPLAPIRENYLIHLAWLAFHRNITDELEGRSYILDCVRNLPVDPKYTLEVKDQLRLKEMIRYYDQYKETGDESLIPLFQDEIK